MSTALILASSEGVTAITVGGALVVALITAVTTNRRQRESLNHDRELTDLADLRGVLDEAAVAIRTGHDKFDNLQKRFEEHGKDLPDKQRDELAESGRVMLALNARLTVRLGEGGPVTKPLEEMCGTMLATWHDVTSEAFEEAADDAIGERLAYAEIAKERFETAWDDFTAAAVAKAGTVDVDGGGWHKPTLGP
jgi:hypothetical protein